MEEIHWESLGAFDTLPTLRTRLKQNVHELINGDLFVFSFAH